MVVVLTTTNFTGHPQASSNARPLTYNRQSEPGVILSVEVGLVQCC